MVESSADSPSCGANAFGNEKKHGEAAARRVCSKREAGIGQTVGTALHFTALGGRDGHGAGMLGRWYRRECWCRKSIRFLLRPEEDPAFSTFGRSLLET